MRNPCALSLALTAIAALISPTDKTLFAADSTKITFDDHILPIFRDNCLNCHNPDKKKGDLDASSYNGLMAGGGSGKVVLPEDTEGSLLWKLINHLEDPKMPPKAPKLADADLATIKLWIAGGLLENSGSKALVSRQPKVDLSLKNVAIGKPDGAPPMPNGDLLLEPPVIAPRPGQVASIAASPWAPLVAIAGQKQVILYNSETLAIEGLLPFPEGFPYVLKFSKNGQLLIAGGGIGAKLGKVVVFNIVTGQRVTEVGNEFESVLAADISADQSQIALGGPSKLVRIYSTATGELLHTIKKHTDWVTALAFSPDGVLLCTGDRAGGVHVWEAGSAKQYSELKAHTASVTDIAWRDDSGLVATTGEDGQIMIWNLENSSRVKNWAAHGGGSASVRFAHDGRLVSTGRDRTTKLWDGNGKQQRAFDAHADIAMTAAVSHDMTKVIAGDYTGEVRVWNAGDGKLIGKLDANPPSLAARIDADAKQLNAAHFSHAQFATAYNAAQEEVTKAAAALEAAKRTAAETAAAARTAKEALSTANQTQANAFAAHNVAQKDEQAKKAAVYSSTAAITSAQQSLAKSQAEARAAASPHTEAKARADEVAAAAAQKNAASAMDAHAASQKTLADAVSALAKSEAEVKAMNHAFNAATAAADIAEKAVPPLQKMMNTATEELSAAKAHFDRSSERIAAIEKDITRWKAAQFNVQILTFAHELEKKENAAQTAKSKAHTDKTAADKAASDLATLKKAISEAPSHIAAYGKEVAKAEANASSAKTAVTPLMASLSEKQADTAAKNAALAATQTELAKLQALLKSVQESAATTEAAVKGATANAAKAKAVAEANASVPALAEAAAKAEQAAAYSRDALDYTHKALSEIDGQTKHAADALASAKAAVDAAIVATTTAQKNLDRQLTIIKEAETTLAAANNTLAISVAKKNEFPAKLLATEAAAHAANAAAEESRISAEKAAAELAPLKEKHAELLAKYRQLKQKR